MEREWVTIGISFLAMIFNGILTYLTYRMLQETKRIVDETYIPEVVVSLSFRRHDLKNGDIYLEIFFCVQNIGTRAARKVRFEGDLSFAPVHGKSLNTINFIKNGIDALRPGDMWPDKIVAFQGGWSKIFGDEVYKNRDSKVNRTYAKSIFMEGVLSS